MILKRVLLPVALFILTAFTAFGAGYDIHLKVNGLHDTTVILGHYLNKSMYPDDTIRLSSKGIGVFHGNEPLPEGMYLMFLPSTKYFELIMGKDQDFSVEVDTADFIHSMVIKGSDENQVFLDFQRFMSGLRLHADSVTNKLKSENDPKAREKISADLKKSNDIRIARIEKIKKEHPQLFVADFLLATLDTKVPDPPRDAQGKVIDSTWQYYYYRNHYFDNFNVSDSRLLRTPIYEDKVITYITRVIPQIPDSLYKPIDFLIEKSRADSNLFRFMLITLFNYYAKSNIMGMDAVQVYLADRYYMHDAWWSDPKFMADLKDRIDKTRPLLIGKPAPDVELMMVPSQHFKSAAQDTSLKRYPHVGKKTDLDSIDAKYLVLLFWEADCGHCKKAVPELYSIYENSLKNMGVKILAISTLFGEDGKIKWVDFVNEHGLYDWMNAWNPYSYDFKMKYDILSTPQIFILDENKKILAKRIGPEQVEEILKAIIKNNLANKR